MNAAKSLRALFAIVALAAVAFAGWKFQTARQDRAEIAAANERHDALRTRIASLEAQLQASAKQAETIERDNALLQTALEQARAAQVAEATRTAPPAPVAPVPFAVVEERFQKARALATQGGVDPAATLKELLWCYEGFSRSTDRRREIQLLQVAMLLAQLGQTHPPALAALRERLEKARLHFLASVENADVVGEIASLGRALRDQSMLLSLYDQLPADDARRRKLAIQAFEPLVETRRYQDALAGRPSSMMTMIFEMSVNRAPSPSEAANPAQAERMRRANIASTAKNIEVLAGAGELEQARALAGRLLKFDDTPATHAVLQQHLERAGQPALLREASKP